MTLPKIVALVPMRHHSERVPGKNYRRFAGLPLFSYIVRSLLACPEIDEVVIDTDSDVIAEDVAENYARVRLIERPESLRDGKVSMNDVLLHDVRQVNADYYLQTHSTNPLLRSETISRAIRLFLESRPAYDSLFSVCRMQVRLWDVRTRPLNHDPSVLLRTQDLAPVYEENSNLYIFDRETLERRGNRIGARPLMFEIERTEAWDIDTEVDFQIAEFLYTKLKVGPSA
jgi:CMP-N-acetylneuraminic acid synthetase